MEASFDTHGQISHPLSSVPLLTQSDVCKQQDLKKQTAMRLAQEQHRQGRFKNTSSFTANPAEQEVYPVADSSRTAHPPPARVATSQPPAPLNGNVPSFNSTGGPGYPNHASSDSPSAPNFDHGDARFHAKKPARSGRWSPTANLTHRDAASSSAYGGNPLDPSVKQKSKLPHGLTVQELKEMTKARLQAEAADKVEDTRLLRTPEPLSAPSETRVAPPPTPPYRPGWNPNAREGWERHPPPTAMPSNPDSFANSDFQDEFDFKRARSYTDGVGGGDGFLSQHGSGGAYNHPPSPSFYDHSMDFNQNRRRAATWSPRLGLTHVQEDYVADGSNVIPSIPVNAPRPPGLQARPITPFGASNNVGFSPNSNPPFVQTQNRPRTSSAVSLPPMSHTADEFDLDPSLRPSPFGTVREESDMLGLAAVFRDNGLDNMPPVMNDLDFSDGLMESVGLSDELATLLNLGGSDDE